MRLSRWWMLSETRPLLGRWCHAEYSPTCDAMRKAEMNTIDHGVLLTKIPQKKVAVAVGDDDTPWDHPTWIMLMSGFGM